VHPEKFLRIGPVLMYRDSMQILISIRSAGRNATTRGVGTAGATGALAPAMFKPRAGARVSFRPRNIFPHFCSMLFLKLPLFVVMLPTQINSALHPSGVA